MNKAVVLLGTFVLILPAIATAKDPETSEPIRDGSSFEKAIIVNLSPVQEVPWIMAEIKKLHPDVLGDFEQGLVSHNGRLYDVYDLRTSKGKQIAMYFDIGKDETRTPSPTSTIPN